MSILEESKYQAPISESLHIFSRTGKRKNYAFSLSFTNLVKNSDSSSDFSFSSNIRKLRNWESSSCIRKHEPVSLNRKYLLSSIRELQPEKSFSALANSNRKIKPPQQYTSDSGPRSQQLPKYTCPHANTHTHTRTHAPHTHTHAPLQ